jgi:hypothetical protein
MEGRTENFTRGDNFTPRGKLRPWGSEFAPRGEVKNGSLNTLADARIVFVFIKLPP